MKTVAFISHKGGVGKSTLAIHLSVFAQQQGLEVLLVDLDSISSTASEWASIRKQQKPIVVTATLADVNALCDQAKNEGFDLVVLDFPPYFSDDILDGLEEVDCLLIPVLPRFPELQSLAKYIDLVEREYTIVLNNCSDEAATLVHKQLKENDIPVSSVRVSRQDSFVNSLNYGLAVSEFAPDEEATEQIRDLFNEYGTP